MKEKIIAYFSVFVPMLIIDGIWLVVVAKNFYAKYISFLMAKSPNLIAAALFYILYPLGIAVFIILPSLKGDVSFFKIFLLGSLFGLIAYSTYDLTNLATIKNWPLVVTVVDIIWGTTYTGVVSIIALYLTRIFA